VEQSTSITELAKALNKLQGELKTVSRDKVNPFFKSKYADLSAVWDACRKPLADHGLSLIQTTDSVGADIFLETLLLHESGEWIKGKLPINPVKPDPQGVGSAISYARRYAMSAMLGIASDEDDDAAAASVSTAAAASDRQSLRKTTSNPASPKPPEKKDVTAPVGKITPEQINLLDAYKKAGYNIADKVRKYGWTAKTMSDVTSDQAKKLIDEYQEEHQ
jgi:hypothetical protein